MYPVIFFSVKKHGQSNLVHILVPGLLVHFVLCGVCVCRNLHCTICGGSLYTRLICKYGFFGMTWLKIKLNLFNDLFDRVSPMYSCNVYNSRIIVPRPWLNAVHHSKEREREREEKGERKRRIPS